MSGPSYRGSQPPSMPTTSSYDATASTEAGASPMDKLISEFRAVIDDTVIIAILSDYDLNQQFDEARAVLELLSQDAAAEEASRCNADGFEMSSYLDDLAGLEFPVNSDSSNSVSGSRLLSDASSRTDLSDLLPERLESLELSKDANVSTLDEAGKVAELKAMFPLLSEVDVKFALRKADGDFIRTSEELLNTQYLEENGLRPKGIEGAFRLDDQVGHKRGRFANEPPRDKPGKTRLDVAYRLAPLNLESEERESIISPTACTFSSSSNTTTYGPRPILSPVVAPKNTASAPISPATRPSDWQTVQSKQRKTYHELALDASAAHTSASQSFTAASQAYRRGKSDALFRPVAGVLAERAREQLEVAKAANSAKYEAMVEQQSSSQSIDLHGVPVADGVRIALDKTQIWWSNLGEERSRKARQGGFIIVTGMGNHSSSGVSRLRQEVGAALKRAGWKVDNETGQFVVRGKT